MYTKSELEETLLPILENELRYFLNDRGLTFPISTLCHNAEQVRRVAVINNTAIMKLFCIGINQSTLTELTCHGSLVAYTCLDPIFEACSTQYLQSQLRVLFRKVGSVIENSEK